MRGKAEPASLGRRAEAALLLLGGLLALLWQLELRAGLPSTDEWRRAATIIAREATAGDAIVLDPWAADRPREYLGALQVLAPSPVKFARPPGSRGDAPAGWHPQSYARIWLLSAGGLPGSRAAQYRTLLARDFDRLKTTAEGPFEIELYAQRRFEKPAYSFRAELAQAQVRIQSPDGREELCPWTGHSHRCARAPWLYVADEVHEVGYAPRACLWAHPPHAGLLLVEYPRVKLGRTLKAMASLVGVYSFKHEPEFGTVHFEVRVDDRPIAHVEIPPGEGGEHLLNLSTAPWAETEHAVSFSVSATNDSMRLFCFDAEILE